MDKDKQSFTTTESFNELGMSTQLPGYDETGIYMVPPTGYKDYVIPPYTTKKLMTRNTGATIFLDDEDFHVAKNVAWFEWKGEAVTKSGVPMDQYLGIKGKRRKEAIMFDYRRSNYG